MSEQDITITVDGQVIDVIVQATSIVIGGGGVISWNGRTLAVVPEDDDYSDTQITNTSEVSGEHTVDAINQLNDDIQELDTDLVRVTDNADVLADITYINLQDRQVLIHTPLLGWNNEFMQVGDITDLQSDLDGKLSSENTLDAISDVFYASPPNAGQFLVRNNIGLWTNVFPTTDMVLEATSLYYTDQRVEDSPSVSDNTLKLSNIEDGAEVNTINFGDNVSDLVNDVGYLTVAMQVGDNVSDLVNDAGYITAGDIPDDLVTSVNGQQGVVVLDTDDISEAAALYYTEARVTANTTVASAEQTSNRGVANGYATLDPAGRIPPEQLPVGSVNFRGSFGSVGSTTGGDLPTTGNLVGDQYVCDIDNFSSIEAGIIFDGGDFALYDDTLNWIKIDSSDKVSSVNTYIGAVVLVASDVGLGNADDTSDANKPISIDTQLALDDKTEAGDNVSIFNNDAGYITSNAVDSVNSQTGIVVIDQGDVGLGNVDNTSDINKPVSNATQLALNDKADSLDLTDHIDDTENPHEVSKAQVGLAAVDNTSDISKPVSTATQIALDLKTDETDFQGHITDTANPHVVTFTQAVTEDATTDITGAECETLTDGSNADVLHFHSLPYFDSQTVTVPIGTENNSLGEATAFDFTVPAVGDYEVTFATRWSHNSNTNDIIIQVLVDGVAIPEQFYEIEPQDSGGTGIVVNLIEGGTGNTGTNQRFDFSTVFLLSGLSVGAHTISIQIQTSSAGILSCLYNTYISVTRKT